ncbi:MULTISPECIES: methyltransferase domain-containing protein [unclassified Beijerinckia]|uniref:class I SAM-dependent DNA methyltransferase n=1 Tax=unclassified Beijerinckia TaxID=2638183 RepID=UPI00089421FE|nr:MULTISPECIES: methyltransferase domain-containing protein [unclassified Beijerinckia]MDH7797353.1 putative TPR repeat methyltransferase [Beijerinckia sp. GAS462]SEC82192.1 Predicted methyltransferase, contains TPR repeat [Beijerinckia sp. 28-YEA-48]
MTEAANQSSGNIVLDRRFAWAQAAAHEGAHAAAADILEQIIAEAPRWPAAWHALGEAREKAGDQPGAVTAFRHLADADPSGLHGAQLHLARLGADQPPARAPDAYVRGLFDTYANRFEAHLTGDLAYRGPQLLTDALRVATTGKRQIFHFPRVIDLGCGTGLMARSMSPHYDDAQGVDLSPRMIEEARRTGLYAGLHVGELTTFLQDCPTVSAELVTAADVLIYLGALDTTFVETARVLISGGLFAFCVQHDEDQDWRLGQGMRYFHSRTYLTHLAEAAGFQVLSIDAASYRKDAGQDVPGLVVVLMRA